MNAKHLVDMGLHLWCLCSHSTSTIPLPIEYIPGCALQQHMQQKNAVTQNAKSINFLLCNSRWLQRHYQGTKQVSFILSAVYTPLALSEMLECCEYVTRYWLPNLLSSQPCRRETSQWWTMAAQSMKNQLGSTKLLMPSHIGCWRDQITSA